jgi:cysteine desulfurase
MDQRAISAMKPFLGENFYNPSAAYQAARQVRASVEGARHSVAQTLGAKTQEIIFTAGGTEANNIAIHGIMSQYPKGNIVVSAIEHESVLEPAAQYECRIAPVDASGIIDIDKLEKLIDENTVIVSVMYANNEIGTVQPIKQISDVIAKKRLERSSGELGSDTYPLYFHTDACQAANYLDLSVTRLGVDLMTLNGGKLYAMKQSGCLYVRAGVELGIFISGGGQEAGVRSGTENVGALHSFATMLQSVQQNRKSESKRLQELSYHLFATLSQKNNDISLNGHSSRRLPNNLNIHIPGVDGERLLMELDEAGLMVATGSACTASNDQPSHVLLACGLTEQEAASSLRITLGRQTTLEEVERAADILAQVILRHQKLI